MPDALSATALAYLKAIHDEGGAGRGVAPGAVAAQLGRQHASVAAMARRLAKAGCVEYQPHAGIRLTETGLAEATRLARRAALLESFLARALGLGQDAARAEAEALLHATSPRLERALAVFLGGPAARPVTPPG